MELVNDCPGGICPVPWAVDTSGDDAFDDALSSKFQEDKIQEYMRPRIADEVNTRITTPQGRLNVLKPLKPNLRKKNFVVI